MCLPAVNPFCHLVVALLGFALLAGLGFFYRRWRGRDGLGLGDAKLAAAGGAWLGWAALPSILLLASLGGFLWVAMALISEERRVGNACVRTCKSRCVPDHLNKNPILL